MSDTSDIIALIDRLARMLDLDVDVSDGHVDTAELIEVLSEACKALAVKDLLEGLLNDAIKLPKQPPYGINPPNTSPPYTSPYTQPGQPVTYPNRTITAPSYGGSFTKTTYGSSTNANSHSQGVLFPETLTTKEGDGDVAWKDLHGKLLDDVSKAILGNA